MSERRRPPDGDAPLPSAPLPADDLRTLPGRGAAWASAPTEISQPDDGGDEPAIAELELGEMVGDRYRVVAYLGRGGMGAVYAVLDEQLDEEVALKLLHPRLAGDPRYRQRLRGEVRLARRVSHPNVCRVHDLGQAGGQLFVTMERVRGMSLRHALRDRAPMSLSGAVDLIVQICSALAAAHRAGVLHRDIKPDNVIVDAGRAVLTDFGVASLASDLGPRIIAGTPAYIAPEVLRGEAYDQRVDVYGAAVVAYELLSGAVPFPTASLDEAVRRAGKRPRPPGLPTGVGTPSVRGALERVLGQGLDFDPAHRLGSADRLAEALANAARGAVSELSGRVASDTEAAPTPTTATARRAEIRAATVLVFQCDGRDRAGDDPGEELERVVVDLGGTPVHVGALAVTAMFGAPVALGDDAERAAQAARALIDRSRAGRAGLDTTRVVLRPGSAEPASPDALAPAAALAAVAAPGEILASPATARQLAAHFDVVAAGASAPPGALRVVARTGAAAPRRSYRARELAILVDLAERCFAGRTPRFVEVRAPAGFGKTRLREALIARIGERREVDWLVAAAPLAEPAPLALVRSADPGWFQAAARAGLADRGAALAAARRWLEARAARRPVGLVLEDVQRADELSRELVAHLRESLDDLPVLVLTLTRPPDDGREPEPTPGVDVVTLGPLDPATATELARSLAPAAGDDAIADVVARAAGHPFFLEELARELAERGPAAGSAPTPLPATVEAVVQQRLDRLAPATREVVEAAAVVGRWFWREAVQRALPEPLTDADLDAALADLERRGLVAPATPALVDDDRYQFAQALVRDVAYGRPGARERRGAHGRVAAWLEARAPRADDAELLLAIAHHRELAGDRAGAADGYRAAGRRCLALFAYREATHALRRAVALVGEVDAELAELTGDALALGESLAEAEAMLAQAAGLVDDAGDQARLWQKLGHVRSHRGDQTAAVEAFERGLALLGDDPADTRVAALLHGGLGWALGYQLHHNDQGLVHCERAVALLEGTPHLRDLAHALSRLGGTYQRAGRYRDQLACNRRNLAIAEEIGDLQMQLTARINLGVVHGVLGDLDDAIAHTEAARALCARTGARTTSGLVASNLGGYHLDRGDLDAAERFLDEGVRAAERSGTRHVLPESHGFIARLRAARGDLAGAAQAAQLALALAREQALAFDTGIALRLAAQIDARAGRLDEARAGIEESARAIGAGDPLEAARTIAARARILARAGDAEGATSHRDAAAEAFERLGARHDRAVLDADDEIR